MVEANERAVEVYRFISKYIEEKGFSPTINTVAVKLQISKSNARYYINTLVGLGYLAKTENRWRAIYLTDLNPLDTRQPTIEIDNEE